MTVGSFIKSKPYLCWYVKNPENLSTESILETVLNYGDFDDVKNIFKIIGIKNASKTFSRQLRNKRHNYRPQIANYFKLYFQKYAQ